MGYETLDEMTAGDPFEHMDDYDDSEERNAGWEEWEMDLADRQYHEENSLDIPW